MANSRPESMIISGGIVDEINGKFPSIKMNGRSSTSSIDSTNGKNMNFNEQKSLSQNILSTTTTTTTTTTSSTTTDSDLESEQDDKELKTESNKSERLSRRVRQFHKLFKSEILEPMPKVINSYVCAYQGDILLQGKMFITDRYLCFHSRIINYVTKHVYRWEQIVNVRKERVAFIFPTAICIQLKQSGKKIIYASFIQRDQAYETIVSIWSKYTNDIHIDDDDDNDLSHDGGTLKANNQQDKLIPDTYDTGEQDVLQMCLKQPNQRRAHSLPRKILDEKHSTKKLNGKTSLKNSNQEQKLTMNQTNRTSRYTKNEQKSNDTTKKNSMKIQQRSRSTPRSEQTNEILSSSTIEPSIINNTNSNGILNIILSFISQIKLHISSYPMKITIIILLILLTLFFHAFYLVKLAYRIENRLQSLHHQWPSTSSMKNSFSSNIKEL